MNALFTANAMQLDLGQFQEISKIAYEEAGLNLPKSKISMVSGRIKKRMRALNIKDFDSYIRVLVNSDHARERLELVSSLTTNVSHFFREEHHFRFLRDSVLSFDSNREVNHEGPLRIWSAGCATGQEPYSIALTAFRGTPHLSTKDLRILATDIDPIALRTAQRGEYREKIPHLFGKKVESEFIENGRVSDALKALISFRQLNLHGPWPLKKSYDVIFCRNVAIYFEAELQDRLWRRLVQQLRPGGWLCMGHSERLPAKIESELICVGQTTYQKPA